MLLIFRSSATSSGWRWSNAAGVIAEDGASRSLQVWLRHAGRGRVNARESFPGDSVNARWQRQKSRGGAARFIDRLVATGRENVRYCG